MKILGIEPTPSPNVMKLNMDEKLPEGVSRNYTKEKRENAPEYIANLLKIEGVVGIFQVGDFISVERHPKADWQNILLEVGHVFGEGDKIASLRNEHAENSFGEVQVQVQMFQGIPMQVKLIVESEEMRFGLPDRFGKAVMKLQSSSPNLLLDRKWVEQGARYGSMKEVGKEVVEELAAAYDQERIDQLVEKAVQEKGEEEEEAHSTKEVEKLLDHPDWEKRFQALERINPTIEDIPILEKALEDSKTSIRRLATAYLGMLEEEEALPPLYKALKDKSAAVRRTAGDALSDIGNPKAISAMTEALFDPNKLVRWRAARFMFEVGDESAIPALQEAEHDTEFEVSLQAKLALERIKRGEEASGTVWQQIAKSRNKGQ